MITGEQLNRLIDAGATPDQLRIFGQIISEISLQISTKSLHVDSTISTKSLYQRRWRDRKKLIDKHKQISTPVENVEKSVEIPTNNTYLLTYLDKKESKEESKKDIIVTKMNFVTLPDEWKKWAISEMGWTDEITQDTWQVFFEYWHNGKGKSTKREKWGATWRTWCRNQSARIKTPNGSKNYHRPFEQKPTAQWIGK